jgi:hypothetical protein
MRVLPLFRFGIGCRTKSANILILWYSVINGALFVCLIRISISDRYSDSAILRLGSKSPGEFDWVGLKM